MRAHHSCLVVSWEWHWWKVSFTGANICCRLIQTWVVSCNFCLDFVTIKGFFAISSLFAMSLHSIAWNFDFCRLESLSFIQQSWLCSKFVSLLPYKLCRLSKFWHLLILRRFKVRIWRIQHQLLMSMYQILTILSVSKAFFFLFYRHRLRKMLRKLGISIASKVLKDCCTWRNSLPAVIFHVRSTQTFWLLFLLYLSFLGDLIVTYGYIFCSILRFFRRKDVMLLILLINVI